jgi:hypothetical protein
MNQRKNILAKFKMNSGSSRRLLDGSSASALRQWAFVLALGIFLTAGAVWWSADRFGYWSSLEERVAEQDVSGATYNQKAVRSILSEYEDRAERAEAILNNIVPVVTEEVPLKESEDSEIEGESPEDVSTSTATSTATSTTSS